jgi:hypothetical protein
MQSRRGFVATLLVLPSSHGHAQQAASAFVGSWKGEVPGVSEITLVITSVGQNGQVEGRMEFALQKFVSKFANTASAADKTNYGIVSGETLTIAAAVGGRYVLQRDGDRLSGRYTRGTTYDVAVTLRKL